MMPLNNDLNRTTEKNILALKPADDLIQQAIETYTTDAQNLVSLLHVLEQFHLHLKCLQKH